MFALACARSGRPLERGERQPVASAGDAGEATPIDAGAIDLAEFGRDPAYRQPEPAPVVVGPDEREVVDELARVAGIFARELSRTELIAELGRPTGDPAGRRVPVDPTSPVLAVMHVRVGGDFEDVEIRFFQPVPVEVLMTRFGAFHDYVIDDREDPEYTSEAIRVEGPFEVTLTINSYARSMQDLPKDRVRVVYLRRRPKPPH
ncbi:MAG: hypothetical protein F9K40_00040 [Kofleriaceae bacterium]|nr:MAG: hypothetical protein F9K40_00040 [Kofleriaceae bacterium]MBZ0231755.1 hypothetical protein [Kofleriaceae bacterium]